MSENKHIESCVLMNMCMVCDGHGNVLALDKVNDSYTGTTFPGGHVEPGESLTQSMIREVFEESGLTIEDPVALGHYQWYRNGVRHIVFLYRAEHFHGELKSSEEGRVYWCPETEYLSKPLAPGMESVWNILHEGSIHECQMYIEDGIRKEKLY